MSGKRPRRHLQVVDSLLTYRGKRLDGPLGEFHDAVDLLEADTVPQTYYEKVLASREARHTQRQVEDGGGLGDSAAR